MSLQFSGVTNGLSATKPNRRHRHKTSKRILIGSVYVFLLFLSVSYGFAHHDKVTPENRVWEADQKAHDCYHLGADIMYGMREILGVWNDTELLRVTEAKSRIYANRCK